MIPSESTVFLGWIGTDFSLWLTSTMAHFLWQGCVIAIGYALVARCLRRAGAHAQYVAGVVALVLLAACLPATMVVLSAQRVDERAANLDSARPDAVRPERTLALQVEPIRSDSPNLPRIGSRAVAPARQSAVTLPASVPREKPRVWGLETGRAATALDWVSPYAATVYLCGVCLMLLRVAAGLWGGRRLRLAGTPVEDRKIIEIVSGYSHRLGLRVVPVVAWCGRVSSPVVVGVLRPLMLLPATLASGLTADQLQAVLIHELAHIRRYDLIVSLLQRIVEALLFFHPAVWWISHRVNVDRENACDDLVLRAGFPRLAYADVLVRVAELALSPQRDAPIEVAVLAATGNNVGQLKLRVLRLLGHDDRPPLRLTTVGMALLALLVASALLVPAVWQTAAVARSEPQEKADAEDQRVLRFPADRAMGVLHQRPRGDIWMYRLWGEEWQKIGEARGDVRVPANADIRLDVSEAASTNLSGLDALQPEDIQALNLNGTDVDDEQLRHVGRLTGLRIVDLGTTRITDAGVRHLAGLTKLRDVNLSAFSVHEDGFGVGDASLKLLGQLPELENIRLRLTKVTDVGMEALRNLRSLRSLGVPGTGVSDKGLEYLKNLPLLEYLRLGVYDEGTNVTDAGVEVIGKMKGLKYLSLTATQITNNGLHGLKNLGNLEDLTLDNTEVTEKGFASLEPLQSLEKLRYTDQSITDVGAEHLAKLKSLRHLTASLEISDRGLAALAMLPHLEYMDLHGSRFTLEGLKHVQGMKSLKWFHLSGFPMTDDGLEILKSLENLEYLRLSGTRVTGEGFKHLLALPKLRILGISFAEKGDSPPDRATLREIGKLTQLEDLRIYGGDLASDDLEDITGLVNLKRLKTNMRVDDQGAVFIGGLAALESLDVKESVITDRGLEQLSNLRNLTLGGHFTDEGLAKLSKLRSLWFMQVNSPYVTDAGLRALTEKLPSLQRATTWGTETKITVSDKDTIRRYGDPQDRAAKAALEDKPPPPMQLTDWMNAPSGGLDAEKLRGKVVLVDFWGTWCGPCVAMTPKLKALHEKYASDGLVILGIHSTNGGEEMADYVAEHGIEWPVAVDVEKATIRAWTVNSYPTLFVIDRSGKLRMAGIYRGDLERAIVQLLAE